MGVAQKRPWIIIITHGSFGAELKKSAEMILGELKNVYCLSLVEGMDPTELAEQLQKKLSEAPDNTIILTDIFGGTPSNVAAMFAMQKDYTVISGVNLPILAEAEMLRCQGIESNFHEKLISSGIESVKNIRELMKERVKDA